jgi:tRNA G18 (ribose-2'-O)-methylase SpoU
METGAVEQIVDPDDPRLADYRHLNDAAARSAAGRDGDGDGGCTIVEGLVALRLVVEHRAPLRSVLLTPSRAATLGPLLEDLDDDVPVWVAERDVLAGIVGFDLHRGVLAAAVRPAPVPAPELLSRCRRVVVAEALNDHENLGALFRNAAALGVEAVLLDDRTADPLYRRSVRVSSGWAAVLPHARLGPLPGGYEPLRTAGFRIVALTPGAAAVDVDEAAASALLDDPVALVVGAEGPGLTDAAIAGADAAVRVPMADGVDSLNVATSLAVVAAFAAARRRWR